ncbi:YCII-related protein [Paraglaciecola sp. T6c]|uniref:YciI family protein n=1 Tax=Pseudoalteromonas atlantica (strain T6c / ATCC BAA-1087) TaxID=3042615 RepID=UPI00005C75BB|nr:YciI family protein [Paraglaciecola sp. T6c]ABG40030.1 YCII-related protein [Paraglaciecola sp. T6c]
MLVQFNCIDHLPSMQDIRLAQLGAHLAWVEQNMANICVAGPLKDDGEIIGSLYVLETEDIDEAKAILFSDPYYLANIWQSVETHEFNAYAGNWVGGKNWPT